VVVGRWCQVNHYDDPDKQYYETVALTILQLDREVHRRTGHSLGAVHAVLTGKSTPRRNSALEDVAVAEELPRRGVNHNQAEKSSARVPDRSMLACGRALMSD
jgi:hypothetical protein